MMKKLLIFLFLLNVSAFSFAQQQLIELPSEGTEAVNADFYFRDVVYKLPADQPIGEFVNEPGESVQLSMGQTPDENIKQYLDKKYPSSGNKTALIVSVNELSVDKSESNTGDVYYEAAASLKFYILNGDMLVILGTGEAGLQQKKSGRDYEFGELVAESINQAIMNFDAKNWKEHPLIVNKTEKKGNQQEVSSQAYPEQKTVYTVTPQKKRIPEGDYKLNQINVSFGYSYRLAEIPEGLNQQEENFIKGLKNGLNFSLNYTNYFGVDWGMGMMFNYSFARSHANDIQIVDEETNQTFYVDVAENIGIGFFGPALSVRTIPDPAKKLNMITTIGLGYVFYLDEVTVADMSMEYTGNTLGLNMEAALGIDISPSAHLLLKAGYFMAGLSSMEIGGRKYELQERESLNRLDINLGLGFTF